MQGPNVKRLIVYRMSQLMVPPGGGIADAIEAMTEPGKIGAIAKEATDWVEQAIALVKTAPDNPYPDDEAIAAKIVEGIEARDAKTRGVIP